MYKKLSVLFTARCYDSVVVVCLSIHPSVCLSQAGIVSKPLNIESRKQRHMTAQSTGWLKIKYPTGEYAKLGEEMHGV